MKAIKRFLDSISPVALSVITFGILITLALANYADFGISWDETFQRKTGFISYNYVFESDPELLTYHDKDYGVAFELPLILIEEILGLEDSQDVYFMRHLISHLFFLFCLWCCYWLVYLLFNNKWLGVAGVLLLVLHPLIYAHSFFNTKDIPFMGMFLVCFLLIYKTFGTYKFTYFILLGVSMGILINLRIMGVMLLVIVVACLILDAINQSDNKNTQRRLLAGLGIFIFVTCGILYITWPYLYTSPFTNFANAFSNMSKFRWTGEVLYMGEMIKATELPWHYAPVWFFITTPIWFLILGLAGIIFISYQIFKYPRRIFINGLERHLLIYLVSFIAPFVIVVLFNSVLYDSWRHLYFVYPAFVILAIYGLYHLSRIKSNFIAPLITIAIFGFLIVYQVVYHPHQHVFFNYLVNRTAYNHERELFELDYWGASYREGIKAILARDKNEKIEVLMWNPPGEFNLLILPSEERARIVITDDNPKYLITNYRFHPEDYAYHPEQEIYRISVQNNTILSVFQLRE